MKSIINKAIIDYLLGRIDPKDEGDFLADCFSSDENAEKFEIIRENLIESYLSGNLSTENKDRFENYFLDDPANQDLFNFAKTLRKQLSENKELEAYVLAKNAKKQSSIASWLLPVMAIGALLVGAVFIGQFFLRNSEPEVAGRKQTPTPTVTPKPNISNVNQEQPTPTENPSQTPTDEPDNITNISPEPTVTPKIDPKPTNTPKVKPSESTPVIKETPIFAFMLPLGSKGGEEDVLVIKKVYKFISLVTDRPEGNYPKYLVTIQKNGRVLWDVTLITLPAIGDGFTAIKVPANKFENGKHRFIISGVKPDGTIETIKATENFFNVRRADKK